MVPAALLRRLTQNQTNQAQLLHILLVVVPQRREGPVLTTPKTLWACDCTWYVALIKAEDTGKERPYSRLCSRSMFPFICRTDSPNMLPTDFLIGKRFPSSPIPPRNRSVPSHAVKQMTSYLCVPFPSRGYQTATFSHTVPREHQNISQGSAGETVLSRIDQNLSL